MSDPRSEPVSAQGVPAADGRAAVIDIDARIDAMPRVGLSALGGAGLLLCYFFSNYDITVIALVVPALLRELQVSVLDLTHPVIWNLVGYCVGAYAFGRVADRYGRQRGLLLTISLLGLGGGLSALSWDLASFTLFRFLAGCGMGSVLALCSTYIGEIAPKNKRGAYLVKLYTVQAVLLIAVGFASLPILASSPTYGWRILLAFGGLALLALFMINGRGLHESPRWLHAAGRTREAERLLLAMERRVRSTPGVQAAAARQDGVEVPDVAPADPGTEARADQAMPTLALFRPPYLRRMLIILGFWFIYYIAVYGFLSYTPLLLESLGATPSGALFVTVLGRLVTIIVPLLMLALIERIERRTLIVIGTLIMAAGLLVLLLPLGQVAASAGVLLINFGINFVVMPAFIYTAEIFPTRARGTAAAIGDGLGHLGGAIAPVVVLPVLVGFGGAAAVWVITGLTLLSGLIVTFGVRTRNRSLTEIAS